jgi:hypothetical protein
MRKGDIYGNAALVRSGCLGTSPLIPTTAISLRTLEVYRQAHRVCPRLSIQAEVRMLCHLHCVCVCIISNSFTRTYQLFDQVPYRRSLTTQFSTAFDTYLEILHRVDRLAAKAMHRDTPEWRMKNSCPPCHYKVENEPKMTFGAQIAMDGNNSLKRADEFVHHGTKSIDKRKPRTDYWQTPEQVDVFKDEVKPRVKAKVCFSLCPSTVQN